MNESDRIFGLAFRQKFPVCCMHSLLLLLLLLFLLWQLKLVLDYGKVRFLFYCFFSLCSFITIYRKVIGVEFLLIIKLYAVLKSDSTRGGME